MRGAFLDTVGLVAVWDSSDQWHSAAASSFAALLQQNAPLVTTEFVLAECGNAAARRPYRGRVSDLRRQLKASGLLYELTSDEVEVAWDAYDRGDSHAAGFVDQTSFVIMRRLGLVDVFSNDQHFQAAGFNPLF